MTINVNANIIATRPGNESEWRHESIQNIFFLSGCELFGIDALGAVWAMSWIESTSLKATQVVSWIRKKNNNESQVQWQ